MVHRLFAGARKATLLLVMGVAVGCAHIPGISQLPPGAAVTEITATDPGTPFAVTPGGELIAFVRDGLKVVRVEGLRVLPIGAAAPSQLAWSPDGARLAAAYDQEKETLLVIYDADGKVGAEATIKGRTSAIAWRAPTELLVAAVETQAFRFGTHVRQILYHWEGGGQPTGLPLHEATVRPANVLKFGQLFTHAFRLAMAPYNDEIVYTRLQDPPEFSPYLKIMLRHLESGKEREIGSIPLGAGAIAFAADGDRIYSGDGRSATTLRELWGDKAGAAVPSPGVTIGVSPREGYVFLDGRLFQDATPVASFPGSREGQLAGGGNHLLLRVDNRLCLVSGLPGTPPAALSPQQRERLLTLRKWRSEETITPAEFLAARRQLLGH